MVKIAKFIYYTVATFFILISSYAIFVLLVTIIAGMLYLLFPCDGTGNFSKSTVSIVTAPYTSLRKSIICWDKNRRPKPTHEIVIDSIFDLTKTNMEALNAEKEKQEKEKKQAEQEHRRVKKYLEDFNDSNCPVKTPTYEELKTVYKMNREEKLREMEQKAQSKKNLIKIGDNYDKVIKCWGAPRSQIFIDNKKSLFYQGETVKLKNDIVILIY